MYGRRLAAVAVAVLLCAAAGCGGSGVQPRPIETLIYVNGAVEGTQFTFPSTADAAACGSDLTGIQAPKADHQLVNPDGSPRVFETPHLFVLENTRQPILAVIRNDDPVNPIQVNLYLGVTPQNLADQGVVGPNECRTIRSTQEPFTPGPTVGPEARIEVCSPQTCESSTSCKSALDTSCVPTPTTSPNPDSTPIPISDRNIAYFASLGDIKGTDITNCVLLPILDACRSPSTFFLQQPEDQVDAVMSVNSGQNTNGAPTAQVRVELYLNGQLADSAAGTDPSVTGNF